MTGWWGTRSDVSPRLLLEVEAMRSTFDSTFRLVVPERGLLYWDGEVEVNLDTLARPEHRLKIVYPADYPNNPAEAYVLKPRIYSEKHQYEDGQLCLFNPKDGQEYGWNPGKSTAVTVAGWAIQWLYAYYTWRSTGLWPGTQESVYDNRQPQRGRRGRR